MFPVRFSHTRPVEVVQCGKLPVDEDGKPSGKKLVYATFWVELIQYSLTKDRGGLEKARPALAYINHLSILLALFDDFLD